MRPQLTHAAGRRKLHGRINLAEWCKNFGTKFCTGYEARGVTYSIRMARRSPSKVTALRFPLILIFFCTTIFLCAGPAARAEGDRSLAMAVYEASEIVVGTATAIKADVNGDVYMIEASEVLKRGRLPWEKIEAHCFFSRPSAVLQCPSKTENRVIFMSKSGEQWYVSQTRPAGEAETIRGLLKEQDRIGQEGSPDEEACAAAVSAICSALEHNERDAFQMMAARVRIDGREPDQPTLDETFRGLKLLHKEYDYRQLLAVEVPRQRYSISLGQFLLGGHSYGYTTLLFKRVDNDWFLDEITHCK